MGIEEFLIERAREEGFAEGSKQLEREKKRAQAQTQRFVRNLLKHTDFSDRKIARLAGVTPDLVAAVKQKYNL